MLVVWNTVWHPRHSIEISKIIFGPFSKHLFCSGPPPNPCMAAAASRLQTGHIKEWYINGFPRIPDRRKTGPKASDTNRGRWPCGRGPPVKRRTPFPGNIDLCLCSSGPRIVALTNAYAHVRYPRACWQHSTLSALVRTCTHKKAKLQHMHAYPCAIPFRRASLEATLQAPT